MADEYIKRESMHKSLDDLSSEHLIGNDDDTFISLAKAHDRIEELPVADVVEVVRCAECKHGRNCVDKDEIVACLLESEWDDDLGIDYGIVTYHSNNHYCGYGERRSE